MSPASLGIAIANTENVLSPRELIHLAGQVLYQAKSTGRNRVEVAKVAVTGVK